MMRNCTVNLQTYTVRRNIDYGIYNLVVELVSQLRPRRIWLSIFVAATDYIILTSNKLWAIQEAIRYIKRTQASLDYSALK